MEAAMTLASNTALSITNQGAIRTITLCRPDVRNAFNDEVIAELKTAFTEAGLAADVRCVVLAAEGPAFCAGADLNWMRRMADFTRDENLADAGQLAAMLRAIYECPKPTIARVQGDVFAGGVGLVAACDMVVSVDTVTYCLSEVKLGLIPATISPYVIRAMGARASHRYFLTAERFSAAEAHRIGLVHEVVAADALDAKVAELTSALVSASPNAVRACKRLVQDVAERDIDDALVAHTVAGIADIRSSAEGKEGVQSFLQKRKPNWLL
jgi:methylglutaconyl-CoA hydratase